MTFLPPGFTFSRINSEMCNSNGYINPYLTMMQFASDCQAKQMMYAFQANMFMSTSYFNPMQSGWGNPWSNIGGSDNAGFNPWSNIGGANNGGFNPWNNTINPFQNSSNSSSDSNTSNLSEEEKGYQKKANQMISLLKGFKDSGKLNRREKEAVEDIIKNYTKDTAEERESDKTEGKSHKFERQYTRLKNVYDSISANTRKEAFIEIYNAEDKRNHNNSFRLSKIGYEGVRGVNNEVETQLRNLANRLDADKITNPNLQNDEIIGNLKLIFATAQDSGDYPILDILSCWNSKFKSDRDNKSIIEYLGNVYDNNIDVPAENKEDAKRQFKQDIITPIVESLITKAEEAKIAKNLDNAELLTSDEKEKISDLIKDIREDLKNNNWSSLSANFDKLYVKVRLIKAEVERENARDEWAHIDDAEIFNDDLFVKETIEDIKSEGFDESSITELKPQYNITEAGAPENTGTAQGTEGSDAAGAEGTGTASAAGAAQGAEGTGTAGYHSASTETGKITEKMKIAVEKDCFVENEDGSYTSKVKLNGKYVNIGINSEGKITKNGKIINKETFEKILKDVEDIGKLDKTGANSDTDTYKLKMNNNPYEAGKLFQDYTAGVTNENETNGLKKMAELINKDNVLAFLKGYRDARAWYSFGAVEGFFEQLKNENDPVLTNGDAVRIMDCIIEALSEIKDLNDEDKERLNKIQEIRNKYNSKNKNANLEDSASNWSWFHHDLDELDDLIEKFINKLDKDTLKSGDAKDLYINK